MITGVCLNPSFDKTVEVDALALGEVNRIRSVRVDMGGKGVNVAVVARRLGLDALCIGCMGEQGAQHFTRLMDEEGLPHRFLTVPGAVRTNLKVVSRDGKGVTELNEPGAPLSGKAMEDFFALAKEEAARSEYVVLTGSLPPGCPDNTYGELIRAMGGTRCILDAGGPVLRLGAEAGPFLLKPNLAELEQALGAQLRTLRAIRDAALIFLRKGASHVVVSLCPGPAGGGALHRGRGGRHGGRHAPGPAKERRHGAGLPLRHCRRRCQRNDRGHTAHSPRRL